MNGFAHVDSIHIFTSIVGRRVMGPVLAGQPLGDATLNPSQLQAPAPRWVAWFERAWDVTRLKKTSKVFSLLGTFVLYVMGLWWLIPEAERRGDLAGDAFLCGHGDGRPAFSTPAPF